MNDLRFLEASARVRAIKGDENDRAAGRGYAGRNPS